VIFSCTDVQPGRLYKMFFLFPPPFSPSGGGHGGGRPLRPPISMRASLCGGLNCYHQRVRVITNEYLVKCFIFRDVLTKNRTDGAMVRLITEIKSDEEFSDADERLKNFVRLLNPYLGEFIPD